MPAATTTPRPACVTLALANRILARQGVVDAFGHVSVRSATDPTRFRLARSMAPARVPARDIVEYDFAGDAVGDGGEKPYLERLIKGPVPVFDIRDAVGDSDMLIRNSALGRELAATPGQGCAVLQRGHGATVAGATLEQAAYLEVNARLQSAAALLAAEAIDTHAGRAWDLWADAARDELQGEIDD